MKWKCTICGWIYDPEKGVPEKKIQPGVEFDDLPENFRCPQCGAKKKWFAIFVE
jgi:rubredoxin